MTNKPRKKLRQEDSPILTLIRKLRQEDSFQEQGTITFEKVKKVGRPELNQRENKKGKRHAKDPIEIHDIKRRQNEGLQAFLDLFKSKSSHIKGVPLVLRISAFMNGHGHPELVKKLINKIPKTVDEMFERVRAFIRGEFVADLAEMIEEDVVSRKLAHLVKDIRRNNQRNKIQGRYNIKVINMIREEEIARGLLKEKGMVEDHQVRRIIINGGSSSEIMYEHCFRNLCVNIQSRQRRCRAPLIGVSRETYHPLGIIDLRVTLGDAERNKTVLMEFVIVK
ncbi:hypothetical protein Tco_1130582 [Tanacetum coccineum]